jgi:hypothetical protein
MRWLSLMFLVVLCTLAGCVAHEKIGDQAAVVGDWKTALEQYQQALINDPNSPVLRQKFQQAQREAVASAVRRSQGCATALDWQCALEEADYALAIDGGNQEAAAMRATAARSLARDQVQQARALAGQGQVLAALKTLQKATALSSDAEVAQEAAKAQVEAVTRGDTEVERLRRNKDYPEAVAMLEAMAAVDPSRRPKLDALLAEQARFQEAEYERLAKEGDAALAARRWSEARTKYEGALQMKAGGRAEPLARYAGGMEQAEAALARRDFNAAAAGFRQAVESGQDRNNYAAVQLQRVLPRPYTLRIRSVLARPLRPDGRPWAGRANPWLTTMLAGMRIVLGPDSDSLARTVIEAAERVPMENRPTLSVIATLPDGTRLTTPARTGLYVAYDSDFVVLTNAFDERRLDLRVLHASGPTPEDVGVVQVALKDLVSNGSFSVGEQSVAALQLTADPGEGRMEGSFTNMRPVFGPENQAPEFSVPTPLSRPFLLQQVRATVMPGDYQDEGGTDGPPDLYLTLEQGGRIIYRSPWLQDRYEVSWAVPQVPLFLEQDEQLVVRLWDADPTDDDLVVNSYLLATVVASGRAEWPTPQGGVLRLEFTPRQPSGPR